MVIFRYAKTDGAEYISHLDMLRHLNKILRRGKISVGYSNGFNHHMNVYMSSPIAVGIKSDAEYCLIESDEKAEDFIDKFNAVSFCGVKCLSAYNVDKKINVAGVIDRACYEISGINNFDVKEISDLKTFEITDKRGNVKDVRQKIFDMKFAGDKLIAVIGFGNEALRPDLLAVKLIELYGGKTGDIIKKEVFVGEKTFENYIEEIKNIK